MIGVRLRRKPPIPASCPNGRQFDPSSVSSRQVCVNGMPDIRGSNGPLVLLVEDDEDSRDMYVLGLQVAGIQAEAAATAAEALSMLGRIRPAVIVTDLTLPDMDGGELCRQLADDPTTRDIPRIVLTGTSSPDLEDELLAVCRIVLQKPCPPDELAVAIAEVLSSN